MRLTLTTLALLRIMVNSATESASDVPKKECEYRSFDTLSEELNKIVNDGERKQDVIRLIVKRPAPLAREIVREAKFTIEGGMDGSGWKEREEVGKRDQICVMSADSIRVITNCEEEDVWAAAGDQLFMDFDLSKKNLEVGDRVVVGGEEDGVWLQVTDKPHNGCAKFATRYGLDALKLVNCPEGKRNRWRGIYFEVIREGIIRQGDGISKLPDESQRETHDAR